MSTDAFTARNNETAERAAKLARAVYTDEYGTLYVLEPVGRERRAELWKSNDGEWHWETSFAAGPKDISDRHDKGIGRGYNAECSCCYLNFSHTKDAHARNLANRAAALAAHGPKSK